MKIQIFMRGTSPHVHVHPCEPGKIYVEHAPRLGARGSTRGGVFLLNV